MKIARARRVDFNPLLFGLFLAATCCVASAQTNCVSPPQGLLSWWKGDGNSLDSVGGHHGVLHNATNYPAGKVQQTFDFNGIDQWVEIPDSPSLNPSNSLTLETWIYVRGNPQGDLATI